MAGKKTTPTGEEPSGKAIRVPQVGTMKVYNSAAPRDTDEDGEPDMRPGHLRQPGASAAEPSSAQRAVEELAAKAGATPRADDDALKNVGRGGKEPPADKLH